MSWRERSQCNRTSGTPTTPVGLQLGFSLSFLVNGKRCKLSDRYDKVLKFWSVVADPFVSLMKREIRCIRCAQLMMKVEILGTRHTFVFQSPRAELIPCAVGRADLECPTCGVMNPIEEKELVSISA